MYYQSQIPSSLHPNPSQPFDVDPFTSNLGCSPTEHAISPKNLDLNESIKSYRDSVKGEHIVQFYDEDQSLVNALVSNFIEPGLINGDSVAIIATDSHIKGIIERLSTLDLKGELGFKKIIDSGQFVVFDAEVILRDLMVNGRPDAVIFQKFVGGLAKSLFRSSNKIRLFGELVDLLMRSGDVTSTIALEQMWCEFLSRMNTVSLYCAYHRSSWKDFRKGGFQTICDQHSYVIPSDNIQSLDEACISLTASLVHEYTSTGFTYAATYLEENGRLVLRGARGIRGEPLPLEINEDYSSFDSQLYVAYHTGTVVDQPEKKRICLPIMLGNNKPRGIFIVGRDDDIARSDHLRAWAEAVTAQLGNYLSQQELEDEREVFKQITDALTVGIARVSPTGTVLYSNPKLHEITGWSAQQILQNGWLGPIHPEDGDRMMNLFNLARITGKLSKTQYRIIYENGSLGWLSAQIQPIRKQNGILKELTIIVEDKTEDNKNEQRKELQQRQRTEEAERITQQTVAWGHMLAHELRNPLHAISCGVTLLQSGISIRQAMLDRHTEITGIDFDTLDKQLQQDRECLEAIEIGVRYQSLVANSILEAAKFDANKIKLSTVVFDVKEEVARVIKMLKTQADNQHTSLRFEAPPGKLYVSGDPDRLAAVVTNLLTNSIKFTWKGSVWIQIKEPIIEDRDCIITIEIKDTGIGMTSEQVACLFEPFVQHASSHSRQAGTGLGLHYTKRFIELMGGNINVRSRLGKGSLFSFTIRTCVVDQIEQENNEENTMIETEESKEMNIERRHISSNGAIKKETKKPGAEKKDTYPVLIVEDNEINRKLMQRLIESAGYRCHAVSDGQEALQILEEKNYEFGVVLMDLVMPNLDGFAATMEIRRREERNGRKPLRIIGLSGLTDQQQIDQTVIAGMNGYLSKPVMKQALFDVLSAEK